MATTIHVPADLLERVDRRAAELEMSRSRYIVQVLRQALDSRSDWSEGFLSSLREAGDDPEAERAVEELTRSIRGRRSSKKPPRL